MASGGDIAPLHSVTEESLLTSPKSLERPHPATDFGDDSLTPSHRSTAPQHQTPPLGAASLTLAVPARSPRKVSLVDPSLEGGDTSPTPPLSTPHNQRRQAPTDDVPLATLTPGIVVAEDGDGRRRGGERTATIILHNSSDPDATGPTTATANPKETSSPSWSVLEPLLVVLRWIFLRSIVPTDDYIMQVRKVTVVAIFFGTVGFINNIVTSFTQYRQGEPSKSTGLSESTNVLHFQLNLWLNGLLPLLSGIFSLVFCHVTRRAPDWTVCFPALVTILAKTIQSCQNVIHDLQPSVMVYFLPLVIGRVSNRWMLLGCILSGIALIINGLNVTRTVIVVWPWLHPPDPVGNPTLVSTPPSLAVYMLQQVLPFLMSSCVLWIVFGQMALMIQRAEAAGEVSTRLAEKLRRYDTAGAKRLLERCSQLGAEDAMFPIRLHNDSTTTNDGTSTSGPVDVEDIGFAADPNLVKAFQGIIDNLEQYRPHLPNYLLDFSVSNVEDILLPVFQPPLHYDDLLDHGERPTDFEDDDTATLEMATSAAFTVDGGTFHGEAAGGGGGGSLSISPRETTLLMNGGPMSTASDPRRPPRGSMQGNPLVGYRNETRHSMASAHNSMTNEPHHQQQQQREREQSRTGMEITSAESIALVPVYSIHRAQGGTAGDTAAALTATISKISIYVADVRWTFPGWQRCALGTDSRIEYDPTTSTSSYHMFVKMVSELSHQLQASLHSFVGDRLVATWNATRKQQHPERLAVQFAVRLRDQVARNMKENAKISAMVGTQKAENCFAGDHRLRLFACSSPELWHRVLAGLDRTRHLFTAVTDHATQETVTYDGIICRGVALLKPHTTAISTSAPVLGTDALMTMTPASVSSDHRCVYELLLQENTVAVGTSSGQISTTGGSSAVVLGDDATQGYRSTPPPQPDLLNGRHDGEWMYELEKRQRHPSHRINEALRLYAQGKTREALNVVMQIDPNTATMRSRNVQDLIAEIYAAAASPSPS